MGQIPVKGEQFGVRLLDWKYIVAPDEGTAQLYDLSRDPGETHDRMADAPAKATELAGRLEVFLATHTRELPSTTELSDADRQRLRALGYVE